MNIFSLNINYLDWIFGFFDISLLQNTNHVADDVSIFFTFNLLYVGCLTIAYSYIDIRAKTLSLSNLYIVPWLGKVFKFTLFRLLEKYICKSKNWI